jgi:hypothetical protein
MMIMVMAPSGREANPTAYVPEAARVPRGGGEAGEEQLVELQRRGGAVDQEFVPLNDGAEDAGPENGVHGGGAVDEALRTKASFSRGGPRVRLPPDMQAHLTCKQCTGHEHPYRSGPVRRADL